LSKSTITIIESFRKRIIAWIVEFCKRGGEYMLQKLSLTGKRISLRIPTQDDLPILYNLIYGVENPEWKKYDAPYYPLEFCTFEKFDKRQGRRNFDEVV
jgi:hypothetical protein